MNTRICNKRNYVATSTSSRCFIQLNIVMCDFETLKDLFSYKIHNPKLTEDAIIDGPCD